MNKFNMSLCKKGDKLISRDGSLFTFKRKIKNKRDPYIATNDKVTSNYGTDECSFFKDGRYLLTEDSTWDIIGFYNDSSVSIILNEKLTKLRECIKHMSNDVDNISSILNRITPPDHNRATPLMFDCSDCRYSKEINIYEEITCEKGKTCKRLCKEFCRK